MHGWRGALLLVVAVVVAAARAQSPDSERVNTEPILDGRTGNYDIHLLDQQRQPQYVVFASRLVRPGTVYRVVAALLGPVTGTTGTRTGRRLRYPLHVRTSLLRDGVQIAAAKKSMQRGDLQTLLLRVPATSTPGRYSLRFEADQPGSAGGTVYHNQTELEFAQRFLTVLIQTNRPIYNFGQRVQLRVVMLRTDLKPFDDPIDVYIIDSDGYIMRRWPSQSSNNGVVELGFDLPFIGKGGWWKVRVNVHGQVEEKLIKLTKYFEPQWEVQVDMPSYFLLSEDEIGGEVGAAYLTDKVIRGNVTLELWARPDTERRDVLSDYRLVDTQHITQMVGGEEFSFPMSALEGVLPNLNNAQVKVIAKVTEYWMNETYTGWCNSKLINQTVMIRFLGDSPQVYKPGMPFSGQVLVTHHDLAPLTEEQLAGSTLTIRSSGGADGGGQITIPSEEEWQHQFTWRNSSFWRQDGSVGSDSRHDSGSRHGSGSISGPARLLAEHQRSWLDLERRLREHEWAEFRKSGLHRFEMQMPNRASDTVELTATFSSAEGGTTSASLRLVPFRSEQRQFLSVQTSTELAKVGEYCVLHVRTNFPLNYFFLVVVSKNLVIHGDRVPVEAAAGPATKTLSLPVSAEMAPSFRVLVATVTEHGHLLTDAVHVPVEGIARTPTRMALNEHKDHSKNTLELGVWSAPGSTFCTNVMRGYLYSVQAGHHLTRASVLAALHSFENTTRSMHWALWRWRDGSQPMRSEYFVTSNQGVDADSTLELAGLTALTDSVVEVAPDSECKPSEVRCMLRGCYSRERRCDGVFDCADRTDEIDCDDWLEVEERERRFRLQRRSVYVEYFDGEDGDWGWTRQDIGYLGSEHVVLEVPETNDDWYFNGFSVSQQHGFALVQEPIHYESNRPFYMSLDMVPAIRRGETIVARLLLQNNQLIEVLALVVLVDSDDYRFVHVERDGVVSHRNARTSAGDHQHLVPVEPEGNVEVTIPIKPLVEAGEFTVTIRCITQFGLDEEEGTVEVAPEGVGIGKHTSLLLDLKNRAVDHKFLNILTEESPEVPYATWRRFVYGSPQASVTVSGDVFGPVAADGPMTTVSVFGRFLKSLDGAVFNLAFSTWTLHYLRLTNQLTDALLRDVKERINVWFILIMKRYRGGPFLFFDGGRPSVWGTAWAARQLQYSQFQDWEHLLYVEPRILSESAEWLCQYQNGDGSFNETEWYVHPLDQKMDPRSKVAGEEGRLRRIPLTAHVLITLHAVKDKMQGKAKATVATALVAAMRYLERSLHLLTDGYEVAIAAYALTVSNSAHKEKAFGRLVAARRQVDSMFYWAREPIDTNRVSRDVNQRPYLQPKDEQVWDAQAVEATSYALLVYLLRDGIGLDQEKMVQWLNSMRMCDMGWISTVDTLVAMQALTEYSNRARLRDITDMDVQLDTSGLADLRETVHITGNVTQSPTVDLENVWGHINVVGTGAGQAVVQLDLEFGIDREALKDTPPQDAFQLDVRETAHQAARNKSIIDVNACFRWINTAEAETSGAAILEVEFPSGYTLDQHFANALVRQYRRTPNSTLMNGKTAPDKIFWFFDRVYSDRWQCYQWRLHRRFLVANYTAYRSAILYEYFAPERFEMQIINSTELNVVDVCQVCGSYQCPYCPWYSGGRSWRPAQLLLLLLTLLTLLIRP